MALTVQQWQILAICLFPFITLLGIFMAVLLGSKQSNKRWFTYGVMFAAGILLSGALVHSLPHANEKFMELLGEDEHGDEHDDEHGDEAEDHDDERYRFLEEEEEKEHEEEHVHVYPWASLIFGLTFLLLLTIEAFVERAVDMYLGDQEGLFGEHAEKQDNTKKTEDAPADNDVNPDEATKKEDTPSNRPTMRPSMTRQSSVYIRMTQEHDGKVASQYLVANKRPSVIGLVQVNEVGQVDEKQTVNPWVAPLLLLVLSIHVLIEGLTIGSVDGDDEDVMRSTFIAIVFHKVFSAFALGSSFITSGYWEKKRPGGRKMFYIMTIFYASMDVVGIGSGMAIGNAFNGESYATAILTSMLGGSFLFVAAVELVPGELEKTRVFKFPIIPVMFSLLVGFGIMSFIGKYA